MTETKTTPPREFTIHDSLCLEGKIKAYEIVDSLESLIEKARNNPNAKTAVVNLPLAEFFVLYSVSDGSTFQDHEDELTKAFAKLAYDDMVEDTATIEGLADELSVSSAEAAKLLSTAQEQMDQTGNEPTPTWSSWPATWESRTVRTTAMANSLGPFFDGPQHRLRVVPQIGDQGFPPPL